MKIPCDNCNQSLDIPDELSGQTIECPTCKSIVHVPAIVKVETSSDSQQLKTEGNPLMKYLIGVSALALGLIIYFVLSSGSTNTSLSKDKIQTGSTKRITRDSEADIANFIANQNLPKMLDQSTRLDSIKFPDDLSETVYKLTITDKLKSEVDSAKIIATAKPNSVYNYLVQDDMKIMRESGINLRYNYYDKNDVFIIDFTIGKLETTSPANIADRERPLYCFVKEANKHLPLMLDHVTKLEKFAYFKNKLIQTCELVNLRKSDLLPTFNTVMKAASINQVKQSPVSKMMLENGIIFEVDYRLNDELISKITIKDIDLL